MRSYQRTKDPVSARQLDGPVISDLASRSTGIIAALDARWTALVLAGQAIDYAVTPGPDAALADVLAMLGLTSEPLRFGRRS